MRQTPKTDKKVAGPALRQSATAPANAAAAGVPLESWAKLALSVESWEASTEDKLNAIASIRRSIQASPAAARDAIIQELSRRITTTKSCGMIPATDSALSPGAPPQHEPIPPIQPAAHQFRTEPGFRFVQYSPELEERYLPAIRQLISKDLSEPYSIYVYRYFLYQWGELCYLAVDEAEDMVGVVVSKLEQHRGGPMRGYIAMLAVKEEHRGKGLATKLVALSIDAMIERDADEVALETEVTNTASLKLYERLGFLRSKRLHRYYLNGNTAFRLLLYLKEGVAAKPTHAPDYPPQPPEDDSPSGGGYMPGY